MTFGFLVFPGVEELDFIGRQSPGCQAVLSVCTGVFLLHKAGLLSGKGVTTHWNSLDRLKALGDVKVLEERFVRDGKYRSSAGVSAGLDMILAFIAETSGEETAGKVQFAAEYYPSPRGYGALHRGPQAPGYVKKGGSLGGERRRGFFGD